MKKVFLLGIFLMISVISNAQENVDVIYLKNGSIIRGAIVEQIPNESITIKTSDGSIFVNSFTDIKKIAKEESQRIETKKTEKNRFSYYSLNAGLAQRNMFKFNLVELNISAKNGFGGTLKFGANFGAGSNDYVNAVYSLDYLMIGPSYSFKAGKTIGSLNIMYGFGRETLLATIRAAESESNDHTTINKSKDIFGIGYTHRFFTNHRWNLLLGADYIDSTFGLDLGFAYSW